MGKHLNVSKEIIDKFCEIIRTCDRYGVTINTWCSDESDEYLHISSMIEVKFLGMFYKSEVYSNFTNDEINRFESFVKSLELVHTTEIIDTIIEIFKIFIYTNNHEKDINSIYENIFPKIKNYDNKAITVSNSDDIKII